MSSISNYSTLTRNTLEGLSEVAGLLYLDLLDSFEGHSKKNGERRALFSACVFEEKSAKTTDQIIDHMASCGWFRQWNLSDTQKTELKQFMAKRHRHNFMNVEANQ